MYFKETNCWLVDDVPEYHIGFETYWNDHGGLAKFGFPISPAEFWPDNPTIIRQWFERARLEYDTKTGQIMHGLVGTEALEAQRMSERWITNLVTQWDCRRIGTGERLTDRRQLEN